MTTRRLLLGTTALVGLALAPALAGAAEVRPGGALDVTVGATVRFLATGGDLDDALLDDTVTTGIDFFNDTEVTFSLDGTHDATGLEYGGEVQLEADTSVVENADETWVYLKGGWGLVRFGDEDAASAFTGTLVQDADDDDFGFDGSTLSAASVAAGTGGLDADIISDASAVPTYEPLGTGDATKITYTTYHTHGVNVGLSYTPNLAEIGDGSGNGDSLATTDVVAGDVVEAVARFDQTLGGVDLSASLSGLYGDIKDEDAAGGDDYWAVQAGAVVGVFGLQFGGSYLTEEIGGTEVDAVTLGVGKELGPVSLSFNYGQVVDSDDLTFNDNEVDQPYQLITSGTVRIFPGLEFQADVAYVDNDVDRGLVNADDDAGWVGVAGLQLDF
jgi:outer membrane protein OmpU